MDITELYEKNREMYLQNISSYLFIDSIINKYGTIEKFFRVNEHSILFSERTLQRALRKFNFQSDAINESWEFLDITQDEFIQLINSRDNVVSYNIYIITLREIIEEFPNFYEMNRKNQTILWNRYYPEIRNSYNDSCYELDEWGNNTEILQMFSCIPIKYKVLLLYFWDNLIEPEDNNYIAIAFMCSIFQHKDIQILTGYISLLYETLVVKPIGIQELINSSGEDENVLLISFIEKTWNRRCSARRKLETFTNNYFIGKLIKADYIGKDRIYDIIRDLSVCDVGGIKLYFDFLILNIDNAELSIPQEIFARLADHIYIMDYKK